jgi:predicted nuclease with TOPRIM domain
MKSKSCQETIKEELILKNENLTSKTQLNDLEVLNKTIKIQNLEKNLEAIKKKYDQLLEGYEIKDKLFKSFQANPLESISKISSLYSDFLLVQYDISARYLESKKNPATMEALRIKDLKMETKAFIEQYRQMLYKYESLLQLFPELSNYVGLLGKFLQ